MIKDYQNTLSDDQAVTESAASANQIDLGAVSTFSAKNSRGNIRLRAQVTTAFADCTSLIVSLRTSAAANMAGAATLVTGPTVLVADLVAGKVLLNIDLPREGLLRYIDAYYTVDGTATAGKVFAGLVMDDPVNVG